MNMKNIEVDPFEKKLTKQQKKNVEYLKKTMDRSIEKEYKKRQYKSKKQNIALIGLGPHAKRIYLNYFIKHKTNFTLLVDLE